MGSPFRIVIVGGGIAGLSAAIALRKDGREITVLEQSSLNREIGATISLQPNASKIVEQQWDLTAALKSKGSMIDEGFQMYSLDGQLQMRIPLKTKDKYGAERVMFHRQDLHDTLKERATSKQYAGKPATIRVSSRVISCNCDKGEIELEDGELVTGDLVIGADGIKSNVRKFVIGEEAPVLPTGYSAYRMMIPTEQLAKDESFSKILDPSQPFTTMVVGYDRRMIMGPARKGTIYSVVALVPDENMNETSSDSSWQTRGDRTKMLETYKVFPQWAKRPLELADEIGLWQLRDLDPLNTWYKGRAILIGDAAHAMLPTQGQGASQSIEDAEALGAFYANIDESISANDVESINKDIFEARYARASLIQAYSRQSAKPATDIGSTKINLNPGQFMDYNCSYDGAKAWLEKQRKENASIDSVQEKLARTTITSVSVDA